MKVNIEGIELNLNDTYYNNFCERLYPVDLRECKLFAEDIFNAPFIEAIKKNGVKAIEEQINRMLKLESEA